MGIAAPILLLCFRLLQGFAIGGEVGPITAYAAEAAPHGHRARYVSMLGTGQGLAVLCSGLIGYSLARLLSPADLDSYGWRIALLLGVLVVPIGLLIRSRLPETFEKAVAQASREPAGQSPWRVFFVGLLVVGAGTIAGYALTYLATYAQDTLKLGAQLAFVATIAQGLGYLCCAYAGGWLGDRFGHRRDPAAHVCVVAGADVARLRADQSVAHGCDAVLGDRCAVDDPHDAPLSVCRRFWSSP